MKFCKKGNHLLPEIAFGKNASSKDGLFRYCRDCSNAASRARSHRRRQSPADRYRLYKQNAKVRGCDFTLSFDHFLDLVSQPCTYCGGFSPGKKHVGIDRLVNTDGYTLGNSVPCCWTCNRMKRDMTVAEFTNQVRRIL